MFKNRSLPQQTYIHIYLDGLVRPLLSFVHDGDYCPCLQKYYQETPQGTPLDPKDYRELCKCTIKPASRFFAEIFGTEDLFSYVPFSRLYNIHSIDDNIILTCPCNLDVNFGEFPEELIKFDPCECILILASLRMLRNPYEHPTQMKEEPVVKPQVKSFQEWKTWKEENSLIYHNFIRTNRNHN